MTMHILCCPDRTHYVLFRQVHWPLLMLFLLLTFVCRPCKISFRTWAIPECTIDMTQVRRSSDLYLGFVVGRCTERLLIVLNSSGEISMQVFPESHFYIGIRVVRVKS